ncbi:B-type flagellar hook-associated protein 2 [Pseudomonas fluorescens]|uniref:flagellar filament capping protein FliD n=1 Tax=Pseudomonas fluorescens TaxID=294 RepID=UPI001258F049|nr:flagellar filament capping protein FliD [Pseudomonas fluorescens]CAG8871073.1 B-type flagellar hook-associated protein 2 [Pseudomonas fluorescens]VVP69070.1 B-type flagellar hook-associated protein 2 [Pseudomonas fluorescens]
MAIDTGYIQSQAKLLAEYEVQRELLQAQRNETKYKAQLAAVTALDTALKAFGTAVKGLKGTDKSMVINAAAFSKEGMASATVGSGAKEGSYQFFVEQLASRHQLALGGLGSDAADGGSLTITQNGVAFDIDLAAADADSDGNLSQEELAAAINNHADNKGVKATLVRSGGEVTMVLTAEETGADSKIELSTTAAGTALEQAVNNPKELSEARNAKVYLGADNNGMLLEQSTNTFKDVIDGVSLTFSKVHAPGDEPLTVDISRDQSATRDKVNEFITAVNALLGTFDTLTGPGGEKGERGPLAGDSSIRSVEAMINSVLREPFGGVSLMEYGILAGADGKLKLDDKSFEKMLDANPEAFEKLFSDKDNLIDTLGKKLAPFTSGSTGSMKARKDAINTQLRGVEDKFEALETKYQAHYQRYLKQYTSLAQVMASMEQTFSMFG